MSSITPTPAPTPAPAPQEMAEYLMAIGLGEDDILDLLWRVACRSGGWTDRLNRVGLAVLKPSALSGEERAA